MSRVTKYSNDIIRNRATNILQGLDGKNGLNGDDLAAIGAFCLIERTENRALKGYEDLEEKGRLLKLPCAIGDTVYTLNTLPDGETVIGATIADAFFCALCMLEGRFGKTAFLSCEDARNALKSIKGARQEK